ncbi:MAG: sensor histidine kinase [Bacteroidota bacterium]
MVSAVNNRSASRIAWHLFACIAFLTLPLILSPHPAEQKNWVFSLPTLRDFLSSALMLIIFYANYYLLIPKLYFRKKYLLYVSCIVLGFLMVSFLPSILTGNNPLDAPVEKQFQQRPSPPPGEFEQQHIMPPRPAGSTFYQEIKHNIILFVAVILFSLLLSIRNRLFLAETARQNAELQFLKAQINPHFLFNTLNSIYSLAIQKDDKTADAVVQLSELMRYIIKDANSDEVSLEKELSYIDNFIELQRSRLGDTATIRYQVSGSPAGKKIAPLILVTFIENAFKHGVNPDEDSAIDISITINENQLHLKASNKKVPVNGSGETSARIGIANAKERLALTYAGKHQLEITDATSFYTVNLLMELS